MSAANWSLSGYGYSAYYPHPLSERKSLNGLVVALTVLLSIMTLVCVVSAVVLFYRSSIFADAAAGQFATEDEAALADAAVMASGIAIFVLYVPIAIVFITWQYRHAKNSRLLSSASGLGPGWAIGGWFIPVANLVLPAIQIHHSSRVRRVPAKPVKPQRSALPIIVPWAITLFVGSALSTSAVGMWPETLDTTADLEAAASSDAADGYSSFVLVVAALLCIAMVRMLSKRQGRGFDAWAAELSAQAQPGHSHMAPPASTWPSAPPMPPAPQMPPASAAPTGPAVPHAPEQQWVTGATPSHEPVLPPATDDDPWRSPS